jgi:hypothetical protein
MTGVAVTGRRGEMRPMPGTYQAGLYCGLLEAGLVCQCIGTAISNGARPLRHAQAERRPR